MSFDPLDPSLRRNLHILSTGDVFLDAEGEKFLRPCFWGRLFYKIFGLITCGEASIERRDRVGKVALRTLEKTNSHLIQFKNWWEQESQNSKLNRESACAQLVTHSVRAERCTTEPLANLCSQITKISDLECCSLKEALSTEAEKIRNTVQAIKGISSAVRIHDDPVPVCKGFATYFPTPQI